MRRMFVLIALLAAGCSDDRGLPPGFLEQAARTTPSSAATPAATASPAPTPTTDLALSSDAGGTPAGADTTAPPILTGPAAEDPATVAEADRVTAVTKDLALGPATPVATPTGDAPFQKLAQEHRFDSFRAACARFHQLRSALLPYGQKLADGVATPEERGEHDRIEDAAKAEQQRLSRMMWRSGLTADDRAAMSWIMFGPTAAMPKRTP